MDERPDRMYAVEIIEKGNDHYEYSIEPIMVNDTIIQIPNLEFTLNEGSVPGGAPAANIESTAGQDWKIMGRDKTSSLSYIMILPDQIHFWVIAESTNEDVPINLIKLRAFSKPR